MFLIKFAKCNSTESGEAFLFFAPPPTHFLGSVFYVGCAVISAYPMLESTGRNDMFTVTHLTSFRKAVNLKDLGSVNKYCYDTPTKTLT